MPQLSKTLVDNDLRKRVFSALFSDNDEEIEFQKINDRQYGCLISDMNGNQRYVRIGAIVAEERTDYTAKELMTLEINKYQAAQDKKAAEKAAKAEKAEKDKERRLAKLAEKMAAAET